MKETKTRLAFFTIPEYEKEQEWLQTQHRAGWSLVNASIPGIYKFQRCKPEEVIYQLDYNQEGIAHKDEYVQMFQDCGWEYITDMAGYSYFRKPVSEMNGKEEIFCDDISRLEMAERVLKGKILPLCVVFFLIIIPQMFSQSHMDSSVNDFLLGVFTAMFFIYLWVLVQFGTQYVKLRKRIGR